MEKVSTKGYIMSQQSHEDLRKELILTEEARALIQRNQHGEMRVN